MESLQHILLECPRWELVRRYVLAELIASIQTLVGDDVSDLSSANTVTLHLGGEYNGSTLESWGRPHPLKHLRQVTRSQSRREDAGTQEHILVDNPYFHSYGCLQVAIFFQWTVRGRAPIIQVLRRQFQILSPTSDLRPVGQGSSCTGQYQEVPTGF